MKKYENFRAALKNLHEIYDYEEHYRTVELTGMVGLYEICFEQSWKAMKELLADSGYEESATGTQGRLATTEAERRPGAA